MMRWFGFLLVVACHADTAPVLQRVSGPGFSLQVPEVLAAEPIGSTYRSGVIRSKGETSVYSVTWNVHALPDDEHLPAYQRIIAAYGDIPGIRDTRHVRAGALDAIRFDVVTTRADDFWSLVVIGCGLRTVQVMVHARAFGAATLQAMLDSFACHPIAAAEQRIAEASPVGLDERARIVGWKRMPDPGAYTLTDGAHAASFANTGSDYTKDLDLLAAMKLPGWTIGPQTTSAGRRWADLTTPDGPGAAASWACGDTSVVGFTVGYEAATARAFLAAFRCPRDGDPPLVAP